MRVQRKGATCCDECRITGCFGGRDCLDKKVFGRGGTSVQVSVNKSIKEDQCGLDNFFSKCDCRSTKILFGTLFHLL